MDSMIFKMVGAKAEVSGFQAKHPDVHRR